MDSLDHLQSRRLLDIGRGLVTNLSVEVVLHEILEAARELTGARYAALGVLNEQRTELERFINVGIDAKTRRTIGDLPLGHCVWATLGLIHGATGSPIGIRRCTVSSESRS
jgi:hypothetical protein